MSEQKKQILDQHPSYEATIGIEVHIQLKTASKIFCSCPNNFGDEPNTNICQICAGFPGVLPVLNKKVVDFGIMAGIATNCTITRTNSFARKHYMYPDLPKNYQVTQDHHPICKDGYLMIAHPELGEKKIRINRIHMEEDAGKNIHASPEESLVDLNRAGTPLLEVVSEPDLSNAEEVRAYLTQLHTLVRYLNISDGNMDEGSFRADVNISVKKKADTKLGTRVELKNINSFKFIVQAIEYELERHFDMIMAGEKIKQETRLWDNKNHKTYFMRSKEESQDYRYFEEPDLPQIVIDDAWLEQIKQSIPELPLQKFARFKKEYDLSDYEADILVEDKELASFFEATVALCNKPKLACNWILRDLLGYLKEHKQELATCKITAQKLGELITEIDKGTINSKTAQDVFVEMAETGKTASQIIDEKDLKQIGSSDELETIVKQIIQENPDNVAKYRSGNERIFTFFIGQAMKATKGKGNPKVLEELFKKHLS